MKTEVLKKGELWQDSRTEKKADRFEELDATSCRKRTHVPHGL